MENPSLASRQGSSSEEMVCWLLAAGCCSSRGRLVILGLVLRTQEERNPVVVVSRRRPAHKILDLAANTTIEARRSSPTMYPKTCLRLSREREVQEGELRSQAPHSKRKSRFRPVVATVIIGSRQDCKAKRDLLEVSANEFLRRACFVPSNFLKTPPFYTKRGISRAKKNRMAG
jgi:hypothetical protein